MNYFFRSNGVESITKYRYKSKEEAIRKCMQLNEGLRLSGKEDRKYIVAKIIKQYVNG